jgi:protoheme IX farnesyltransferase
MAGNVYLYGALALGLVFVYYGLRIRTDRTRQQARRVLLASVVYLPLLFSLMLFDRPA